MITMMMKIESIWQDLENDKTVQAGLLYKRFPSSKAQDVYVALRLPENLRCIATLISSDTKINLSEWSHLQDIRVELFSDKTQTDRLLLLFLLLNPVHKDIFSVLCEDLIEQVAEFEDEGSRIQNLLNRLFKWENLFMKLGRQGLSAESQRGLFGELSFIEKLLSHSTNARNCVDSWVGPSGAVQDFQNEFWAVEVKTTHGKNHQKLMISNERQLDNSIIPELYLYHLSIDERLNSGETLNEIVERLRNKLSVDQSAQNCFNSKLHEIGYFDVHSVFYEKTGYTFRQENFYVVNNDFPRIIEKDLMHGVGDVKYSVIVSENMSYFLSETDLFEKIKF